MIQPQRFFCEISSKIRQFYWCLYLLPFICWYSLSFIFLTKLILMKRASVKLPFSLPYLYKAAYKGVLSKYKIAHFGVAQLVLIYLFLFLEKTNFCNLSIVENLLSQESKKVTKYRKDMICTKLWYFFLKKAKFLDTLLRFSFTRFSAAYPTKFLYCQNIFPPNGYSKSYSKLQL